MKFIRCVIEVRPLRLLVDCMAACACIMVSLLGSAHQSSSTGTTYGLSKSILIRKSWAPLAFVLLSKRLVVSGSGRITGA